MTRSFTGVAVTALLLAGSSTAAWAGCACGIGHSCTTGFSNCYFDDGGNCWTVSGYCLPKIGMIPGAEVITVVYADGDGGDNRFAFAGCSRTLAERGYSAAEAEALRAATHDLSL